MAPVSPVSAETAEETAATFGVRQSILDISLSPSGRRIAFVGSGPAHTETLNIIDLDGDLTVKPIFNVTEINSDLVSCEWATDERLVCRLHFIDNSQGQLLGFTRVIALDADGNNPVLLTSRSSSRSLVLRQNGGSIVALDSPDGKGRILMTKQAVEERSVGTRFANTKNGLGVDSIDVESGKSRTVEAPDPAAAGYLADENGRIRMLVRQPDEGSTGYVGNRLIFFYRGLANDEWHKLSDIEVNSQKRTGLYPLAVDSGLNVAYAFDDIGGFDALVEVPLDGSSDGRVLLARDDVDVDHLVRIGRQRRVIGASYATEKRAVEYFDSDIAALARGLSKALPGTPLIDIVGASTDESRLLIIASSDTDAGTVYLLDRKTNELNEILPVRRFLEGRAMGKVVPISYPARDGTEIPGYLTLPPGSDGKGLPGIVLPHGGPSARDEWGFDWLVQFFVARGYAVLQPNYRGSAGYGEAWFGKNGFQAWPTAIGDVNDAGRWLVSQGIVRADQLAIVGWSYGGYAALQAQVLDPELFHAVVAIAPVTDLPEMREYARGYTNARLVSAFLGEGPHLTEGSPARHAEAFRAPVLLFHGTLDQNVNVQQSRIMANRLRAAAKSVEYVEYEDLAHSLSDSKARTNMLQRIDEFLGSELGSSAN
ncbi:S9 family peptidase [Erythrobacter mangrovi]|uniref:S9 family peptidase n=1 Tax=Erythrobacter mangrovi TaxID=2739433 RepID=A0A7D3XXV8_9SPHN|nr:S9 family peptidase [Erythrobacter mangrovi]